MSKNPVLAAVTHAVFELRELTDRQTNKQTYLSQYFTPLMGTK